MEEYEDGKLQVSVDGEIPGVSTTAKKS